MVPWGGAQAGPNLELLQPRKKDAIRVLGGADALRGMQGQVLLTPENPIAS